MQREKNLLINIIIIVLAIVDIFLLHSYLSFVFENKPRSFYLLLWWSRFAFLPNDFFFSFSSSRFIHFLYVLIFCLSREQCDVSFSLQISSGVLDTCSQVKNDTSLCGERHTGTFILRGSSSHFCEVSKYYAYSAAAPPILWCSVEHLKFIWGSSWIGEWNFISNRYLNEGSSLPHIYIPWVHTWTWIDQNHLHCDKLAD